VDCTDPDCELKQFPSLGGRARSCPFCGTPAKHTPAPNIKVSSPVNPKSNATIQPMRIFMSYRRINQPVIEKLVALLKGMGHEVWYDQHITGGQAWWDVILHEARECDLFITAISPSYLESKPCQLEYQYAISLKKRILPILVEKTNINAIPVGLQSIQIVQLGGFDAQLQSRLETAFLNLPQPTPMPNPLPLPPPAPISPLSQLNDRVRLHPSLGNVDEQVNIVVVLEDYLEGALGDGKEDRKLAYQILKYLLTRDDLVTRAEARIKRILARYKRFF
jgi:hypothetical protein